MKIKIFTTMVLVLFLAMLSIRSVAGQYLEVKVIGRGWFDSNVSPYIGQTCYFWIDARGVAGPPTAWTGIGFWLDKTSGLRAILTVEVGYCYLNSYWCTYGPGSFGQLGGTAEVFIDDTYIGTYGFGMLFWDGPRGVDNVGIWIWVPFGYQAQVWPPESLLGGQIVVATLGK